MPTFPGDGTGARQRFRAALSGTRVLGAFFRTRQATAIGIDQYGLRALVADGVLEKVGRGLYRRLDIEATERYSLAGACARVPNAVVCLLSALQVHEIETRVPRDVWLAIPHKARAPTNPGFRLRVVRFSGTSWTYGVEQTRFEGVQARITTPARTVVDCFRFARIVSRETAMEGLHEALRQRKVSMTSLYRVMDVIPSRRLKAVLEAMPP